MHCTLLAGVAVLCLTLPCLVSAQTLPPTIPTGILKTECRGRVFWIWGDKSFFGSTQWKLEAINDVGLVDLMLEGRAAQCGYTLTSDLYGNVEIRISFLACWVKNMNDQRFDISVQLRVVSGQQTVVYPITITCHPRKQWDVREIICEENYMEVSVTKITAALVDFLQLSEQVAGAEMYQAWEVAFFNSSTGTIPAEDAYKKGYGVSVTVTRVVLRAPYNTSESQIIPIDNYTANVIYSKMHYTQTLLDLYIGTTLACPRDPPVFTDQTVSWLSPAMLKPLVPGIFLNSQFIMGINGRLLSDAELQENMYSFQDTPSTVAVTIPLGAPGGYSESDIVNNTYVTTYHINLMLQRKWIGARQDDNTTHTQYKPVVTPHIKQIPIFKDYTIKAARYFNVSLGNFYPDVNTHSLIIHHAPLALAGLVTRGMTFTTMINANNTRVFYVTVPFSDPLVEQMYLGGYERRYRLYVTYVLILVPKEKNFTYTGVVECILEDVVPPQYIGSCGSDRLVLDVKHGNLDMYWIPYIRNIPLTNLITSQKYVALNTDTDFHLEVPYPSIGLVYEVATLNGFRVRLDFSLRDNKTLKVESTFSVICTFPPASVCVSNGTIIAVVNSSMTKPQVDARKTYLKDPTCKPQESNATMALFSFPAYTCGTTRKFDSHYLTYENEVMYDRAVLFPNRPIISRDSTYRLTIRCRYPVNDSLWLDAQYSAPIMMKGLAMPSQARVLRRRVRTHMAELKIAKDENFTSFYQPGDFPVHVHQADSLYIQADVPSTVLVSLLQDCWAATFPSHDGQSQWDLVVDGCAITEGALSTAIHTSDHSARLHVQLDGEVNGQAFYVHCQVSLCDPKHTDCFPACNLTTKRVVGKRAASVFSEVVSAGPIKVTSQTSEVDYQHLAEGTSWSMWSWVLSIGLGVIAALTVCAIFLGVRLSVH